MTRKQTLVAAAASLLVALIVVVAIVHRQRLRRQRVFHPAANETAAAPVSVPPIEQWTATFSSLDGEQLVALLDRIRSERPREYEQWSLGYLHARSLIEAGDEETAAAMLEPFLAESHPLREFALHHRASIEEDEEASPWRRKLIRESRASLYRDDAIDEEVAWLSETNDLAGLEALAEEVNPSAPTERRRELNGRIIEALATAKRFDDVFSRGFAILDGGINDDAADRVARALDRPELIARMSAAQRALLGQTLQSHRHYERAIALLQLALRQSPTDELQFALGRSHFGNEQYAQAQAVYLRGANTAKTPREKAAFFWHAARSAQLQGEEDVAERYMTAAIAVPGSHPATYAALTQRLRTRIKARRFAEAAQDLTLLRKIAAKDGALVDGSIAYAVGMLGAGNAAAALRTLDAIPRALRDKHDDAEIAYWRGRSLEAATPAAALNAYLDVLRADVPTHFAYFARKRVDAPAFASRVDSFIREQDTKVSALVASGKFDEARRTQTDRVLLSSRDRAAELETLRSIYRELPAYRAVLDLTPEPLPRFPLATDDRGTLLMAMGLPDEATDTIQERWGLRPIRAALTRSAALNAAAASRDSIYAIEVMMKSVPADFHPDLLPPVVRRLLFPRYFYTSIASDAKRYDADPALILAIMREESRFNPRAKSQAAARGLLQFIITTARDIGNDVGLVDLDPEDLYDPRVIIRLGAKYVGELLETFGGNPYAAAAAYNAGPNQTALWRRLQAAEGDDYFLTAVNFDETRHYVRKVMNSHERYREIYGGEGPAGGLRAEP